MRRSVPLLAALALLLGPAAARGAPPRRIATGTGDYVFAGPQDVLAALLPPAGSRVAPLQLLRPGTRPRPAGSLTLPKGERASGVGVTASARGELAVYSSEDDLGGRRYFRLGPLGGPLHALSDVGPRSSTLNFTLEGDHVIALRTVPAGATSHAAIVTYSLAGRQIGSMPLTPPDPALYAFELRAHGGARAVMWATNSVPCRTEVQVLGRAPIPVPAYRAGGPCVPRWSSWDVQADGKLVAAVHGADDHSRLAWFDTAGVEHHVAGIVDDGAGVALAADRLLYVLLHRHQRSDLTMLPLLGTPRVLARFDAASADGVADDFDGTRALFTESRCAGPMIAYEVADVAASAALARPPDVVCGLQDVEREASVGPRGGGSTTLYCRASGTWRCRGSLRLSRRGKPATGAEDLNIPGGGSGHVGFRLNRDALRALRAAAGPLAVREELRWRDEHGRRRTATGTLYLDGP